MPAWWVILAILRKDLEDAVRSHTLLPFFLGPILLSLFFARVLSDSDLKRPEVAVYDPGASRFVGLLQSSDVVALRPVGSAQEGRDLVVRGKVSTALVVPEGFDQDLADEATRQRLGKVTPSEQVPTLELTTDESHHIQVEIVRQSLRGALREVAGQKLPGDIRVEKLRDHRGGPRLTALPVWATFAVLGAIMLACASIVEEKDTGTLEQILCGPVGLGEVLAGKLAASWLMGFLTAALVLAVNGGWAGLLGPGALVLVLGSLAFAGLGTLIGLWAPSQATGTTVAGLVLMALFIPSALADSSQSLARAAAWSPGYYFQDGISRALLGGAGLADLGLNLAVLAATVLIVFSLGIWRLRQD